MRAKLALLGFFFLVTQARAAAKISDIKVQLDGERVLATFTLQDAFDHRFSERVDSGLPTSIYYQIELDRDRKRWWDQKLEDVTLEVVALYDAVARSYTVHYKLNDKLIESKTVRDRKALEEAMTIIDRLPVFEVERLPKEGRALIKIQAETGSRTLLSFIPVAIKTDWKESPKFRAPRQP
ncbi:MAG TPA: DUF4390 domain-containing protein [Thermoanaerobaculia bacterium]|nr:DUF4390 domain-containing protein [Thermoanaerobaculia bacterium]